MRMRRRCCKPVGSPASGVAPGISVVSGQTKPRRVAEAGFGPIPRSAGYAVPGPAFQCCARRQVPCARSRHGQGHQPVVRDLRASGEHTPRTPPVNVVSPRAPAPPCRGSLVVAGKTFPVSVMIAFSFRGRFPRAAYWAGLSASGFENGPAEFGNCKNVTVAES